MQDIESIRVPVIRFGGYTLRCRAAPLSLSLFDAAGEHLVWQLNAVSLRTADGRWQHLTEATVAEAGADRCILHLADGAGDRASLRAAVVDDLLQTEIRAEAEGCAWVGVDLTARPDEHYLGFGERFDSLDQRGREVDLWVVNGAQCGHTYKPIPFFQSSAGYGLWIDADVRSLVRLATPDAPDTVAIRSAAPGLRLTVLPGSTPKEILSQYTALAGRPEVPPDWAFGPWKSRDWQTEDQSTVYEDLEQQRALGLPCTVKLIDAMWEPLLHTFAFDPAKYPDPAGMIDRLHAEGYRLVLWLSPWMVADDDPDGPLYTCAKRHTLIHTPEGKVYIHRLGNSPTFFGSCLDFTNPEAVAWWQGQVHRLVETGVDGFKTDFGEQVPEDACFYDGRTGREMHNAYPRLYNQVTYEAMQQGLQDARPGVLLARSAWHGSQGLSAIWAGDQTSDLAPASGLPSVLIAGQSAGLSGFPYWASDIGGYFGVPTAATFLRWSQFGAFSPIMQIHGAGLREPWLFGDEVLEGYRRCAQLHMDLFPYIYSYAHEAARTGIPIMRALALEFPSDPGIWGDLAEHEYCFGSQLLVAPVYHGPDRLRILYLPHGLWCDFWTGERLAGGEVVRRPAPVDQIPVFARAGAIIPRLDPAADTLLPASRPGVRQAGNDLRIDLYPGADGSFRLYDGTLFAWDDAAQALTVSDAPLERQVCARRVGCDPGEFAGADRAGRPVQVMRGSLNGEPDYARATVDGRALTFRWRP